MSEISTSVLRQKTILGVIWAGGGQFGAQILRAVILLILTKLLSPADFGLVSQAMIFILLSQSVGELGLSGAIIQRAEISDISLCTIFWINLLLGFSLTASTWLLANNIANVLGNMLVAPLLRVLSITFLIASFSLVPRAMLAKKLEFRKLYLRKIVNEVGFGAVALTLALSGYGAWSLVGATIVRHITNVILLWGTLKWRPKLTFDLQSAVPFLQFGLPALIGIMLQRVLDNIDYFVIGRWLGTEALGYYTLAFQLTILPIERLVGILRQIAFPTFSLVKHNLTRLSSGFTQGTRYIFAILIPFSLIWTRLGPWLVKAVYGQQWIPSISPLVILALGSFFYGFDFIQPVYYAIGKPHWRIWLNISRAIFFLLLAFSFGISMGIAGIAICIVTSMALTSLFSVILISHLIGVSFFQLLRPVWQIIKVALPVFMLVILIRPTSLAIPYQIAFFLLLFTSMLVYLLILMRIYNISLKQLLINIQKWQVIRKGKA